jgi:hypothetical protein
MRSLPLSASTALLLPICMIVVGAGCGARLSRVAPSVTDTTAEEQPAADETIGEDLTKHDGIEVEDISVPGPVFVAEKPHAGGTRSDTAINLGLKWLVSHQAVDGHWSLDGFDRDARCSCTDPGQANDIAGTAYALLPLLAAGQTHKDERHPHRRNIERGLNYLLGNQTKAGDFGGGMHAQGLATMALCEAFALSKDAALKEPAQRAINFVVAAQAENGGWASAASKKPDTMTTAWQVMALKSGQMGGLNVPARVLRGVPRFLDSVASADQSRYGLTGPPAPRPKDNSPEPTAAAALLCRQYLGWGRRNPALVSGIAELNKAGPSRQLKDICYLYFATQVIHHVGSDNWNAWDEKRRDLLLSTQDQGTDPKHAHQKGSWSPDGDHHCAQQGRLACTSLALLNLEIYHAHLPVYHRD